MDLIERKKIRNIKFNSPTTQDLPKFSKADWEKFKAKWNDGAGEKVLGGVTAAIDAAGTISSMSEPDNAVGDFFGKYGTTEKNIDGVGYQEYNKINEDAELSRMSAVRNAKIIQGATLGATAGAGFGLGAGALFSSIGTWGGPVGLLAGLGLGAMFGGIAGNDAKHEEEHKMLVALRKQNNYNEQFRTDALTSAIQNRLAKKIGDPSSQLLFSASTGSEGVNPVTNETYKKFLVHTGGGKKYDTGNARVSDGEILIEGNKEHVVKGNPNIIDGELAHITPGTKIVSNNEDMLFPGTNMTFAEAYPYAKAAGMKNEFFNILRLVREKNNMKNGLIAARNRYEGLPKFDLGLENIIPHGIGLITSLADLNSLSSDDIHNINYKPYNKYEGAVANLMLSRRPNVYPILQDSLNQTAKQRRAINQSGGLGVGQRTVANIANNMNNMFNRANIIANALNIMNQYNKETAELLNNMGTHLMTSDLDAFKFNKNYNAMAHNAMIQQKNMAKYNALQYLTDYFAQAWKKKEYDRNYNLYAAESKRKDIETQALIDGLKNKQTPSILSVDDFFNFWHNLSPYEQQQYLYRDGV